MVIIGQIITALNVSLGIASAGVKIVDKLVESSIDVGEELLATDRCIDFLLKKHGVELEDTGGKTNEKTT